MVCWGKWPLSARPVHCFWFCRVWLVKLVPVWNAKDDRQDDVIVARKQPHGLSCQTELRAPYCLSASLAWGTRPLGAPQNEIKTTQQRKGRTKQGLYFALSPRFSFPTSRSYLYQECSGARLWTVMNKRWEKRKPGARPRLAAVARSLEVEQRPGADSSAGQPSLRRCVQNSLLSNSPAQICV